MMFKQVLFDDFDSMLLSSFNLSMLHIFIQHLLNVHFNFNKNVEMGECL